jgi:predicted O-linked N-acetylglucosamine transferase (SPINDLY family)
VRHSATEQLLENALAAQRRGSIGDAKRLYASVLSIDPKNAAAHGNLAVIAAQQGDLAGAERLFREQIRLMPAHAPAYNNLGLALQQQGKLADAIAAHRKAVTLNPNYAEALLALGNVLRQQGDIEGALVSYRSAIAVKSDYAEAYNNAGIVLQMQARLSEAVSAYSQAVALSPGYAEAHFNLGVVLHQRHELDAAEAAYRKAILLNPAVAAGHNNLGTVLQDRGDLDGALAAFDEAIKLKTDYAEAHFNRGAVLQRQAKFEQALLSYDRAIALRKDYADAINNVGIVLQEIGRSAEAIPLYRRLLELKPANAEARNNLGVALLAQGFVDEAIAAFEQALTDNPVFPEAFCNLANAWRERGNLARAMAAFRDALRLRPDYPEALSQLLYHRARACDWDDYQADQQKLRDMVRDGIRVPPFYLLATPASASDQLVCARQWIRSVAPPQGETFSHQPRRTEGRIRLAYLSGDFHQHATAQLMAELFEMHDRKRFEIVAYSYGPDDKSPMRARLQSAFDRFVDIHALSHRDAAELIHSDQVDILVDLKGYTHGARSAIPAYRPAPVQVSYLGYPATMGADFIDYIIVDSFVVPSSQQPFFSERLVHVPNCYQVNDRKRKITDTASRQACGLPADGLVLCSFNNSYKISPAFFDIWMRLLRALPGSVLWLLEANELVKGNLRSEAEKRGIDSARLVFAPIAPLAEHLGRHRYADLFLDTLPCNAHTTASDALWAGLPVLTCAGNTFAGRVAASALRAIGMPELITGSLEEFEQMALALGRAPQRLIALRQKLEQNRDTAPLFNLPELTGHLEAAYVRMWQIWQSREKPAAFSVDGAK